MKFAPLMKNTTIACSLRFIFWNLGDSALTL